MPDVPPGGAEQTMREFGLGDEDITAWQDSGR
jgi:hypothetical protein